jgi:hypothetical protein
MTNGPNQPMDGHELRELAKAHGIELPSRLDVQLDAIAYCEAMREGRLVDAWRIVLAGKTGLYVGALLLPSVAGIVDVLLKAHEDNTGETAAFVLTELRHIALRDEAAEGDDE